MTTVDANMIYLIELLIFQKKYRSVKDFCTFFSIDPSVVSRIKSGKLHFTINQIDHICKIHRVNLNWVFGIEKNIFFGAENPYVVGFKR